MTNVSRNLPALLLLTDGRFPAGGHAHSGGFEAAAENEGTRTLATMEQFLLGRLHTVGLVAAAFAAAACEVALRSMDGRFAAGGAETGADTEGGNLHELLSPLDAEFNARTPSPVLRTVSRRLGRQLVRAGRRIWPNSSLEQLASVPSQGLHQPVAFGAVAAAAGQPPECVAIAAAQESIAGPATASVRLLGLDPFDVNAALARLAPEVSRVAAEAAACARFPLADLPSRGGYLLDISAEVHATWEVRLFAS
ncbi:urease accessory protein UreF [Cryobacterium sp. N22]|uniref:urease accessory protein UreF n=1 Tax=Cryobacterium sp. N22 TaxID=2048290 RepID=UPI000CE55FB0|nr:urease accessory UreF family protein [Cryobacterium sp. N22]